MSQHIKNQNTLHQQTNNDRNSNQNGFRRCKKYFVIDSGTKIFFNSDYDSGNLQKVQQVSTYVVRYRLYPAFDRVANSTNKTYFHFKVYGFKMCIVKFLITRIQILEKLLKMGQQLSYKPVFRRGKGKYQPLQKGIKLYYNKQDEVQLSIQYQFEGEDSWTQFAFSYPYSYEDTLNLVKELHLKYKDHPQIYFHEEVLGFSEEGRKLLLINITNRNNCQREREEKVQGIFPSRQSSLPFKINKPKVIISGRVHPGQTPASFCVQGALRFLLDEKDYRAYLLRKNFHFIIVPMLNPDGVYHGLFRSDLNGQNLNRVYVYCNKLKHPTIWSFKEYLKYLQSRSDPVLFYFDFHAHPSKKQFFIYGNAFTEFNHQVQAETFGKLLENNCPYFHNIDSIFSEKQMNSKDRYDAYTKQGCGRVFTHRLFNIIHSYTVQCGYFSPGKLQKWEDVETIINRSQVLTQQYKYIGTWEKCSTNSYTPESYMLMGKSILITILDLFHLNPYTRININELRSIATIRKNIGIKIYNSVERFRMIDGNAPKKIKELTKLLQQEYYKQKVGSFGLSISENYGMKHPKKTYSLMSRVYMSKKQLKLKLEEIDPEDYYSQVDEIQQQIQNIQSNHNTLYETRESNLYVVQHPNNLQLTVEHQQISSARLKVKTNFRVPQGSKAYNKVKKSENQEGNQITYDCLHINHIVGIHERDEGEKVIQNKVLAGIQSQQQNVQEKDRKKGKTLEAKSLKRLSVEKETLELIKNLKRKDTQKKLEKLKLQNGVKFSKRDEEQKEKKNEHNLSIVGKNENRIEKDKKLINSKNSRIDSFLRKESNASGTNERISQIQKYINKNIGDIKNKNNIIAQSKQAMEGNKLPPIYSKSIQKNLMNKIFKA